MSDVTMTEQTIPIGDVQYRQRANIRGRIRSLRVRPWGDSPTLEVVVVDDTGGITLVFLARRHLAGVRPGTVLRAEGMVGAHQRRLAMLNPIYELEPM
jgi:RecG-like helicase